MGQELSRSNHITWDQLPIMMLGLKKMLFLKLHWDCLSLEVLLEHNVIVEQS